MTIETDGITPAPADVTPVDPAPAAIEADPATAQDADPASAEPPIDAGADPDKPKREPWFQTRINELTAKRHDAQREADYWRGVAEASRQPAPQPAPDTGPPTLEQCGYDDAAFQTQTAEYFRKAATEAAEKAIDSRTAKEREQNQINTAAAKMQEGAAKHSDFMDVVHDIPLSGAVLDLLVNDPNAADTLYAAAKDPAEARRIFSLSPYLQAVELGKIAARLETPAAPSPKPIPPAPPATVGGVAAGLNKAPEEMSMTEYIAWRKKADA